MITQMKLLKNFLNHFFVNRYQIGLDIVMRGIDLILDCVHLGLIQTSKLYRIELK